jgi:DNA polymerase-3 subunit delta'
LSLTHPDVHFSYPSIGANAVSTDFSRQWRQCIIKNPYLEVNTWLQAIAAENKQGNINTKECNAIIQKLSLKNFEGKYKILIMWLPEYLEANGNRLLKLIEEPPENTIFILVTENPDKILPTIISRCQVIRTEPLTDEEIEQALQMKAGVNAEKAKQIAFMADGNFNQALQISQIPENDDANLLLDWLRKCWSGHGTDLVLWTENFSKLGRENQKQFLQYSLHFMRELLNCSLTGNTQLRLNQHEINTAQKMAKVLNFDKITRVTALLNENAYFIERNANPKILFLDTAIQIHHIMKSA